MERFTDDFGTELVNVHDFSPDCIKFNCTIHHPSVHSIRNLPLLWRSDRFLFERICRHGTGHPDPDNIEYIRRTRGGAWADLEAIHGCDGCCW